MAKNLVIVESPAKVKTIKKFLGDNYDIEASNGHVRDLPKSQLGIDIDNDYEPKYITIRGKGDILANLRKKVKKADKIYLATDPDREGEAISWHLYHALKLEDKNVQRITFNEITKNAVKASLKAPRDIDMNLVDAQQTRRILDRFVGYLISPVIWAKVKRGLSAGRVQSAALHMICEREEEINAFIPEEYWSLEADLKVEGEKKPLRVKYCGTADGKNTISSKEQMDSILEELKDSGFAINDIKTGTRKKQPPLPFTTSTLQQEASNKLNFSTQKTMRIAQQLYEGVDVKGKGTIGIITYLRTDSTRISEEAEEAAHKFISKAYGEIYAAETASKAKKSTGKIQDAHEAIRPTDITLTPAKIKDSITKEQFKLYQLIWTRFTASRMTAAVYDTMTVDIAAGNHRFDAASSKLSFEGFLNVYNDETKKDAQANIFGRKLDKDTKLELIDFDPKQHFTQPPQHYTEASLVKAMEEAGVGRPSTYAPTITTILARHYVAKESKKLYVTELGEAVDHLMTEAFPAIVNLQFTANMESLLDGVEDGSIKWKMVVRNFYPDLEKAVEVANQNLDTIEVHDEVSDEICDVCGRNMVVKYGPHGKFLACPGFPECKSTKPYFQRIGVKCPKCGDDVVIRTSKKGRRYFGCINNPECDFVSWQKPTDKRCEKCGSYMIEKGNKLICSASDCGFVMNN